MPTKPKTEKASAAPVEDTREIEAAYAQAQANQEKVKATVQAARTRDFELRVGCYASLLYGCEIGSESAAREVEKLILERDTLQSQRDDLLAACRAWEAARKGGGISHADLYQAAWRATEAAIAKAEGRI